MDTKISKRYFALRAKHPMMSAANLLRWAKENDAAEGWEANSNGDEWTKQVDGFTVKLTVEDESYGPVPNRKGETDYGKYVDESRSEYSYDWNGNWPEPSELAEFVASEATPSGRRVRIYRFSYQTIRYSGPGWHQGERGGYFIPDGIKDQFEWYRKCGQSRSVALDLTRKFIEDQLTMLFVSPLCNVVVWVKAYKEDVDIELGSACCGTDVSGDDEGRAYIFQLVKDADLIGEAIEEAKTAIVKLTEA